MKNLKFKGGKRASHTWQRKCGSNSGDEGLCQVLRQFESFLLIRPEKIVVDVSRLPPRKFVIYRTLSLSNKKQSQNFEHFHSLSYIMSEQSLYYWRNHLFILFIYQCWFSHKYYVCGMSSVNKNELSRWIYKETSLTYLKI